MSLLSFCFCLALEGADKPLGRPDVVSLEAYAQGIDKGMQNCSMEAGQTMVYLDLENSLSAWPTSLSKGCERLQQHCCTDFTFRVIKDEERQGNFNVPRTLSLDSTQWHRLYTASRPGRTEGL